jgi:DNA topoisomerase IB
MIDANGALYTSAGKKINGFPGPGFSIQMNPDYNPKSDDSYVFTTINDSTGKRSQHVYTVDYRSNAIKQKFEKVQDLDKDIDAVRKKWLVAMKKTDKSIECVAATALEMMYQFSARVGSMGNSAGGEATFGISTLLGKHCKIDGDKITIAYTGKGGVKQVHKLQASTPEAKVLVKNLKMLLADKGPKDRVFTFIGKSGRELPMTGGIINKVFQRLGAKATVHKLRHVRGTRLFNELVEHNKAKIFNEKKPLTEAQAVAMFKQLATKVGELLGHVRGVGASQKVTPSTAVKNYIDPGAMKSFFTNLGFRPPKLLGQTE